MMGGGGGGGSTCPAQTGAASQGILIPKRGLERHSVKAGWQEGREGANKALGLQKGQLPLGVA